MSGLTVGEGEQLAGIQTGLSSDLAGLYTDQGQLNADMAIGIGGNLAGLEASRGASNSNIIGDTLAAFSQPPGTTINVGGAGAGAGAGAAAGGAAGGGTTVPGTSISQDSPLASLVSRATGGNLTISEIEQTLQAAGIGDVTSVLDAMGSFGSNLLTIWNSSGVGVNGLDFLNKAIESSMWDGPNGPVFDPSILNNGTDNIFTTAIFSDPATTQLIVDDPGLWDAFTGGLSDIWDNTGGALWDWAKETFL